MNIKLIREEHSIKFDLFHKATFSGKYFNYNSQHPVEHKKGIIYGMLDKTILLTYPDYDEKNLKDSINILLNNSYPLDF